MGGVWITLQQGQSAESLAFERGHFLETVWQHDENASLRDERTVAHVLFPGDRLFLPDLEPRTETGATDRRHRFRMRGVPSRISFQLQSILGETLANVPYTLELGETTLNGTTDGNGNVTAPVLPDEPTGTVRVAWRGQDYIIELGMRQLDPVDTMEGVQKRLGNLGFYKGDIDGIYQQATIWAIQRFQLAHGLPTTGSVDDDTKQTLLSVHGC